jgi:hypothetical protein
MPSGYFNRSHRSIPTSRGRANVSDGKMVLEVHVPTLTDEPEEKVAVVRFKGLLQIWPYEDESTLRRAGAQLVQQCADRQEALDVVAKMIDEGI